MTSFELITLLPILPELCIALSAMGLLMVGAYSNGRSYSSVMSASVLALLGALYLAVTSHVESADIFSGMFIANAFTRFAKEIVLVAALMALALSSSWLAREDNQRFEYPILVLFSTLGMMAMISANDLIALYMGLELSSLALYVLASFMRDDLKSAEAGLKYFVLGALASGMLLFGASLVYGFAGSTSFAALAHLFAANAAPPSAGVLMGVILLMVGFCFKISAVPFHMWTPDVYEGAPTPVTAFFATASKVAALALFCRLLMEPFGPLLAQWQQIIVFVAIASMAVGALGALVQSNIKRLLAYSSIGHAGYALVGLAAGSEQGAQGLLIYLALYIFMSAGAFACVLRLKRNGVYVEEISELAGLSRTNPQLAFLLALFMFSMAGIPPLAGFFGKFYIFLAAVQAGLIVLAVLGVLFSVVAAFYYIKIVKLMYFDEAKAPFDRSDSPALDAVLVLSGVVIFFFFVYPTPLITAARSAASVVLPHT